MIIVSNEVMDDAKRYIPQPISRDFSLKKVIIDKILLIIPITNITIVIVAAMITVIGCSDNLLLRLNS
jgi:hypothetical protein